MLTEPIPCVQDDVTLLDCLCISTSVLGACRVHLTISHWPAVGHPDGRLHGGNSPRAAGTAAAARRWGSSRGWPPGAPLFTSSLCSSVRPYTASFCSSGALCSPPYLHQSTPACWASFPEDEYDHTRPSEHNHQGRLPDLLPMQLCQPIKHHCLQVKALVFLHSLLFSPPLSFLTLESSLTCAVLQTEESALAIPEGLEIQC